MVAFLRDTIESQEMEMFPGPLKNDVIKFCERKIAACTGRRDMADKESYILLWDMLVLLGIRGRWRAVICMSCSERTVWTRLVSWRW